MLENGWQIIQQSYEKYTAMGIVPVLFISCVILLIIKENKSENKRLAYYIVVTGVILFFPPISFVIAKFIGKAVYWRVFWLFPSVIVIAFIATKWIEQISKKMQQIIFALLFVVVIILGGKSMYGSDNFAKSTNLYKLPQEAIEICELVKNEDSVKMAVPETIVSYIRQYDAKIDLLYGRNLGKDSKRGKNYKFLLQLNSDDPDIEMIAKHAKNKKCNYVVFEKRSNNTQEMLLYGYEVFGSTQNYIIFKKVE